MQSLPTIAVLSPNEALTAVLGATLRREHGWRVREFRDPRALSAYMRIAPLTVLVTDYALGGGTAADLAYDIRNDLAIVVSRDIQIIALARQIDADIRRQCVQSGVDELIVKPMSPLYLEERVRDRVARGARRHFTVPNYVGPERRGRIGLSDSRALGIERRGDNVIAFPFEKASPRAPLVTPDA